MNKSYPLESSRAYSDTMQTSEDDDDSSCEIVPHDREREIISVHNSRHNDNKEHASTDATSCFYTAESLLRDAPAILAAVDDADIFRSEQKRMFPHFDRNEVILGKVLGRGSFGVVREVVAFNLHPTMMLDTTTTFSATSKASAARSQQQQQQHCPLEISQGSASDYPSLTRYSPSLPNQITISSSSRSTILEMDNTSSSRTTSMDQSGNNSHQHVRIMEDSSRGLSGGDLNVHYDVASAKKTMKRRCMRHGDARYAVKSLDVDSLMENDMKLVRGRIDVAIEIMYLQALNHPNIVRMRGLHYNYQNDPLNCNAFFLMDRLYGTLAEKFKEWKRTKNMAMWIPFRKRKNREILQDSLCERLVVAYDVRSALEYMHSHKMIYRDLKPENIGFDIRGDVKVFDFGLAKSLHPDYLSDDHFQVYHLSAPTGSFPYMAPEVANVEPYNEKCDVFSFGILLYEIMSLSLIKHNRRPRDVFYKLAFEGSIPRKYRKTFSPRLLRLCEQCWNSYPKYRPSMKDIGSVLNDQLSAIQQTVNMDDRNHQLEEKSTLSMKSISKDRSQELLQNKQRRASTSTMNFSDAVAQTVSAAHNVVLEKETPSVVLSLDDNEDEWLANLDCE